MSLHLEFEPHSWYKGFAIKKNEFAGAVSGYKYRYWQAYTDNGNTYFIDELTSYKSLKDLKQQITDYYTKQAERDAFNRRMIGE